MIVLRLIVLSKKILCNACLLYVFVQVEIKKPGWNNPDRAFLLCEAND